MLSGAPGRPGHHSFVVNTEDTPATAGERLDFTTPRLLRDQVLAGSGTLHLAGAFTADDGNIAAVLHDEAPDGTRTRVSEAGSRRAIEKATTTSRP